MERAFAEVAAEMLAFDAPLATLANPDSIPAPFLPWLAWSLGIRSWKPYWSEQVKRLRVRHAIQIARRQGTAQSVEDVVASFGAHAVVRPWHAQNPPGQPFTFQIDLAVTEQGDQATTAMFVEDILSEVSRTKSARDHYTFNLGLAGRTTVGIVAAARVLTYVHLQFTETN